MKATKWNALAVLATAALLLALAASGLARDGGGDCGRDEVRLEGALDAGTADPGALGEARFESRSDRRQLRIDIADVSITDEVDVFVNGVFIGSIVLDNEGSGRLELNTQDGDRVPPLQDGAEVVIVDAEDLDTVILSGTLRSTE
jgi:hypothetical protein